MISTKSKYLGCMLGMACGDALGAPVEMKEDFPVITEMQPIIRKGGTVTMPAGTWTDDTSMALCLAESLITKKGLDTKDQLERYSKWLYEGYYACGDESFGSGRTTRNTLKKFKETGQLIADVEPELCGNGSIMRLAPLVLYFGNSKNENEIGAYSFISSTTTHTNPICTDACVTLGIVLWRALNHKHNKYRYGDKDDILRPIEYPLTTEVSKLLTEKTYKKEPPYINGSGHAFKTLEAAIWAFYNTNDMKSAIIKAVNLGGDTDTVAAICGALSGLYYGYECIPRKWLSDLQMKNVIWDMSIKLYNERKKTGLFDFLTNFVTITEIIKQQELT